MAQYLRAGFVLPNGDIVEHHKLLDEHASAFIEWQKRHPIDAGNRDAFLAWMRAHDAIPMAKLGPC